MGQLRTKLKENGIVPILAVTKQKVKIYKVSDTSTLTVLDSHGVCKQS